MLTPGRPSCGPVCGGGLGLAWASMGGWPGSWKDVVFRPNYLRAAGSRSPCCWGWRGRRLPLCGVFARQALAGGDRKGAVLLLLPEPRRAANQFPGAPAGLIAGCVRGAACISESHLPGPAALRSHGGGVCRGRMWPGCPCPAGGAAEVAPPCFPPPPGSPPGRHPQTAWRCVPVPLPGADTCRAVMT